MAVSTTSYFSNATVGVPQVGSDFKITDQTSSPKFALGTKFERQDGAIFRYVHFGAAVTSAGVLLSPDVSENGASQVAIVASSSSYRMEEEPAGVYPGMKNSRYILLTKGSVSADDYAGGYLTIQSGTAGHGATYRIKGNTATGTPAAGAIRVQLYDKLSNGFGAASVAAISGCKYNNLEAASYSSTDGVVVGASILSSGTTNVYGWVQSKGIVALCCDTNTPIAGKQASLSTSVAGAVSYNSVSTAVVECYTPVVGTFVSDGSGSQYTFVDLNVD